MLFQYAIQIRRFLNVKRSIVIMWKTMSSKIVQTRCMGCDLLVRVNEDVGKSILAGEFEVEDIDYFQRTIKDKDVVFDVGANVGVYSITTSKRNPGVKIFAFEPIPINAQLITTSLLLNGIVNVQVIQKCASDRSGEVVFSVADDSAYSSMVDTRRKPEHETIRCQAVRLDDFCTEVGIRKIDLVKIDVEGAEELVIRGAGKFFSDTSWAPRLVLVELYNQNLRAYDSSIEKVLEIMCGYGYAPFILAGGKKVVFERKHHDKHYNVFFERAKDLVD